MPGTVNREELLEMVASRRAQLAEVLPKHEYDEEHLPGAIHLPLKSLTADVAAQALDPARPVIVYCWDSL